MNDAVLKTEAWVHWMLDTSGIPSQHKNRQLGAAAVQADDDPLRSVLCDTYPRLLGLGYDIPLSLALDISYIYLNTHGTSAPLALAVFDRKRRADRALKNAYRQIVEVINYSFVPLENAGTIGALLTRCRLARRQNGSGNGAGGLLSFLMVVAAYFQECIEHVDAPVAPKKIPDDVRQVLTDPTRMSDIYDACIDRMIRNAADRGSSDASNTLRTYLEALNNSRFGKLVADDGRAEVQEGHDARIHLGWSGAHRWFGHESVDYELVNTALSYTPLELSATSRRRLRRFYVALSRFSARFPRPDSGNHGMTRRGDFPALLKSQLPTAEIPSTGVLFISRYLRRQLLYHERHSPREEPKRVLLLWIADTGKSMRYYVAPGLRRDTYCRMNMLLSMEDAVSYLGSIDAIEMTVGVLLFDPDEHEMPWSGVMGPAELRHCHPADKKNRQPWLARERRVAPHFFFRPPPGNNTPAALGKDAATAMRGLRAGVHSLLRQAVPEARSPREAMAGFDAIHVSQWEGHRNDNEHTFPFNGANIMLTRHLFDESGVTVTPSLGKDETFDINNRSEAAETLETIRKMEWDSVFNSLHRLP